MMKHHCINLSCWAFLFSWAIAQGMVQFYLDDNCSDVDGSPIQLDEECKSGYQATAIAALSLTSCGKDEKLRPILAISDSNCFQSPSISPPVQSGNIGDCLYFSTGIKIDSIAFACVNDDELVTISNTPPAETQGESSSPTPPPVSAERATSSQASSSTSSSRPSATQASPVDPEESGGLSVSDKITMGCSIGIGLPALVFAILTWYNHWDRREQDEYPEIQIVPRDQENGGDAPPPYELRMFRRSSA
jgi:hypothetical protein